MNEMFTCCIWQGQTDEEVELWVEEIQSAVDNANKDAQFGLKCKYQAPLDHECLVKNLFKVLFWKCILQFGQKY